MCCVLCVGCWVLCVGCWVLGVGLCWVVFEFNIFRSKSWILLRIQDFFVRNHELRFEFKTCLFEIVNYASNSRLFRSKSWINASKAQKSNRKSTNNPDIGSQKASIHRMSGQYPEHPWPLYREDQGASGPNILIDIYIWADRFTHYQGRWTQERSSSTGESFDTNY